MEQSLEIQRFEFDRKSNQEILAGEGGSGAGSGTAQDQRPR